MNQPFTLSSSTTEYEAMRLALAVMLSQAVAADWFDDDPTKLKVVAWLQKVKFPDHAMIGDIIEAAIAERPTIGSATGAQK